MTAEQADTLITWLELEAVKLGTDNQRERWRAMLLPDDELKALVREPLFSGFENLRRWQNLTDVQADEQISHSGMCRMSNLLPAIEFSTEELAKMTHGMWETFKVAQTAADKLQHHPWFEKGGSEISLSPRTHVATCAACKGQIHHASVLVTIQWAGRVLTREYKL